MRPQLWPCRNPAGILCRRLALPAVRLPMHSPWAPDVLRYLTRRQACGRELKVRAYHSDEVRVVQQAGDV